MSNSKWFAFKCWFFAKFASLLPEPVKRFVLYELADRVGSPNEWTTTFAEMYKTLKD